MMRRTVDMTVEFTEFDRPRLLGSKSRSVTRGGPGRPMVTVGRLMFERVSDGTRMHWAWEVETPGAMRVFKPIVVDGTPSGTAYLGQPQAAPGGPVGDPNLRGTERSVTEECRVALAREGRWRRRNQGRLGRACSRRRRTCRGSGSLRVETEFSELADVAAIAVDVPIGFGPRRADAAARAFMSGQPAPCSRRRRGNPGDAVWTRLGASAQAHALGGRILHMTKLAATDRRVREVHPEVSFRAMNEGSRCCTERSPLVGCLSGSRSSAGTASSLSA